MAVIFNVAGQLPKIKRPNKKKIGAVDKDLVRDLELFMENDANIMRNYERSFLPNIARKIGSGKFDKKKLPKLMEYHIKNSMPTIKRFYADVKLNKEDREALAKELSQTALNDLKYNYDILYNGYTNKYEPIKNFTKGKTIPSSI